MVSLQKISKYLLTRLRKKTNNEKLFGRPILKNYNLIKYKKNLD